LNIPQPISSSGIAQAYNYKKLFFIFKVKSDTAMAKEFISKD
jgi:hypothetical protein